MSRATALARGRVLAEAGMSDTCTIVHPSGGVLNQQTGARPPTETVIYTGRCRVQDTVPGGARLTDEGEASQSMLNRKVQLPVAGTGGIQVGDKVTITACPNDADMVGRVFVVRALGGKTDATARRIGVEEVT